jgi:hypothetical protein
LNGRLSGWKRRRGSAAAPKPSGTLHLGKIEIGAIVIAVLVAISGFAYFAVYDKPKAAAFGETVHIQIYGYFENGTSGTLPASYAPDNFTVMKGTIVTLKVDNTDNITHGLAVPHFNVDTGPIQPNGTAMISFTANAVGFYTWNEPSADCGGGTCDSGQAMNGNFTVTD